MCAVRHKLPSDPAEARRQIRAGLITGQTSGMAPGRVQGNLVILPADWAGDFLEFCLANPKPCPLLAVGEPGDPSLPTLGGGIDIRTDVPSYRVFRNFTLGRIKGQVEALTSVTVPAMVDSLTVAQSSDHLVRLGSMLSAVEDVGQKARIVEQLQGESAAFSRDLEALKLTPPASGTSP